MYTTSVQISKINAFQCSGRTRNLCSKMGLRAKDTLVSPHEGEPREFQAVRRGRRPWSLGPRNTQASPRPPSHARDWEEYSTHTEVRCSVPYVPSYATTGGHRVW